jgi:hypothetical protein
MPVPVAVPIAMAAASVVGALIQQASNAKSLQQQKDLIRQARDTYAGIEDPEQKAQVLEMLKRQGTFTPEIEQVFNAPDSALASYESDPDLIQAQKDALWQLKDVSRTGLNDSDRLEIERAKRDMVGQQTSRDAGILDNLRARGMNSPGMEAAMRQATDQRASDSMANYQAQVQAEARNRALQAMMQSGQLAGNIRGQGFDEAKAKADAIDRINQFNAANRQRVAGNNVDRTNNGALYNMGEDQRISDANTGIRNANTQYNNGADQRRFDNQITKANGMTGQTGNAVQVSENGRKANADMWSGIIQGVNKGAATWANSDEDDKNVKPKR